jgi:outer membrane receptor protein involved in Fe transport
LFRSYFANACTTGLELAADINLTATLRLQGSYTVLDTQARRYLDRPPPRWPWRGRAQALGEPPCPVVAGRRARVRPDAAPGRRGERRQGAGLHQRRCPLWLASRRNFDLAVVGQNLFDNRHLEYASDFFASQLSYQPRRGYVQGLWRF